MADTDVFDDLHVIALTAWGEARSLGLQGMQATINTGLNRMASGVTWWEKRSTLPADTLRSIFLMHYQYSCWNIGDVNRPKLFKVPANDQQFVIALALADQALDGTLEDITDDADSYFDTRIKKWPAWAQRIMPCFEIPPHAYFRTV